MAKIKEVEVWETLIWLPQVTMGKLRLDVGEGTM